MSLLAYNLMRCLKYADSRCREPAALREYLEYADESISAFDRTLNRRSDGSHWCTRWGKHHCYAFDQKVPRPFDYEIASDVDTSDNSPNDFLTYAASSGLITYVGDILNRPGLDMDPIRATQLAVCATAQSVPWNQCHGWRQWKIQKLDQFELVARIVRLGADPTRGLNWSIWEEVVRFLYEIFYVQNVWIWELKSSSQFSEFISNLPQNAGRFPEYWC